jgi:hypothetical protein
MMRIFRSALTTGGTALAMCGLFAAPGRAALTHQYIGSFGPSGTGPGAFGFVQSVTVDQSTQDVYVYDDSQGGRIYKFDGAGEPVAFSGLASGNEIESVGTAGEAEVELAVDDSSGPDKGDIYIANTKEVAIYSAAGVKIGSLTGGEMCGVATDAAGHVYVGIYPETVKQYVPTGNPVINEDYVSSLNGVSGVCNVGVDSSGDMYAAHYYFGVVHKYEPSQFNTSGEPATGVLIEGRGRTLAVDPVGTSLLLDGENGVVEFDDSAEVRKVGEFGNSGEHALERSFGIGVNGTSGNSDSGYIYAGDAERVSLFGPALTVADVSLEPISTLTKTTVALHGSVNPAGVAVTACDFEYWTEQEPAARSVGCTPAPGAGGSPVAVAATLSGLASQTLYHVRLSATDANGSSMTTTETFETEPAVEDVRTEAATGVAATGAVLNGVLAPDGLDTHYYFQYGETREYGAISPAMPGVDAGSASQMESAQTTLGGLEPNTTYHYRLVASNEDGTTYGEDLTFTTLSIAARLGSQPPSISMVQRTSAIVNVAVFDASRPATLTAQFVSDAAYAPNEANPYVNGATSQTLELAGQQGEFRAPPLQLPGLLPGTTYHFRVVLSSALGTAYSADGTFTTAAPTLPTLETAAAGSLTATSAELSGTVVAQGLQTSYEFEVGTDTSYTGAKLFGNAGQSAAPQAVSAFLQFLLPGTTYHYRLVATNADGTTYGPDMAFTTPGVAAPITQPAVGGAVAGSGV